MKKVILAVVMIAAAGMMTPREPIKIAPGHRTDRPCFPVCGEQQKLITQVNHHPYPLGGITE